MAKKNKRNDYDTDTDTSVETSPELEATADTNPEATETITEAPQPEGDTPMAEEAIAADEVATEKKIPFCNVTTGTDGTIYFSFANGKEVKVNPHELPEEQQENLTRHGLVQKVRDSFASAKGNFDFAEAAASKVIEQLKNNQWTASRGSGESKPHTGELVQALAELKGLDIEVVQAAVDRATEEKRKAWRSNAEVKAKIAELRAAAARKRAETSKAEDIDLEVA
jgi:hypothetical protein